jgi:hypothetical protein
MGIRKSCAVSSLACNELILSWLSAVPHWPPWCKTNIRQEDEMIRQIYFSHYRALLGAFMTLVTIGAAMLLSYFILLFGV